MTRIATLALAALLPSVALAAPQVAETCGAADAPTQRLELRELNADQAKVLKHNMRKRVRSAGYNAAHVRQVETGKMMTKRTLRSMKRARGIKPLQNR